MKIQITTRPESMLEEADWRDALSLHIVSDGQHIDLKFHDGEPEDANLSRDFSDCYKIEDALELAYQAGLRGEELEIERLNEED